MPFKKAVQIVSHGVPASFHRVDNVSVSLRDKSSNISVSCFFDEAACKSGAQPLATPVVYLPNVMPEAGQDLLGFAESALTESAPEGNTVSTDVLQFGGDRYLFANAEVVA